ncbi:hypothetical protein [Aeromonas veronii]|uniref:hypothetical protein n=1 Tax=Aeromonas veronii TaxID=654 RepID=UPI003D229FB5
MSISIEEYVLLAQQFYEGRNYSFNVDNLEKILSVSESAFKHYPRVFSFRVDLRFQQVRIPAKLNSHSGQREHPDP